MNIIGTNIISSLGFTTNENFEKVKQGISGIQPYDVGTFDLPEAFRASLIDKKKLNDEFGRENDGYTNLEKAAILSVLSANKEAEIDLSSEKTLFILSTTKGNVDWLDGKDENRKFLWHTAGLIAGFFQNPNTPIVVSNACISGSVAQIVAMRELETGKYDYAVVVGVDFLSKFIISGFQSFKALAPEVCRPFDKERCGLNLGEAAATVMLSYPCVPA
jgi:3-oxoacyl-[acyl-carrier-protein] synthase-1